MPYSLENKNAVITGANRGLGLEIARGFLKAGISGLALCARNKTILDAAAGELRQLAGPGQKIISLQADVSRPEDVNALCLTAIELFGQVQVLVNNAGIYGPKGSVESVDWEEWQQAININLGGSILMCRALLPHFKQHRAGKIIQISGGGATNPLPFLTAYAASKAAIVRFIESLSGEVASFGIDANNIAPGLLDTRLLDEVLAAGPEAVGQAFYDRMAQAKASGNTTPLHLGAELAVFLASDASNGITGRLISAQWDNWQVWPDYLAELEKTDLYTLRRITGRDRGQNWGDK
ncbi:MAG: SDR family oxidoreductase [Planctomycetes bacterium]|nr:SDR family oxidoreductase [Planctomycetota bacterium]